MYYGSMAIAILGLITYQLSMKAAPREVNPWWLLSWAYAMSAGLCLVAGFLWRRFAGIEGEASLTWSHGVAALCISVTVILIEIGYLLVYRSGWSMSLAPAVGQAVTLMALLVIGYLLFGEKVTLVRFAGVALCAGGFFLIVRK